MGAFLSVSASAQVNVTTYHNDIGRTGQNLNETVLTTSNVNATQFGKLFSQPVDGQVYAQPLYLSGITVNGATHNVVFVATENDSVYAFDADSNGGTNSGPLWKASMLLAAHGAAAGATTIPSSLVSTDIQPQVGITGTPVIDPASGTLYVVSAALEGGSAVQRLHALDVTSGAEKFGGPVVIAASVPGTGNGSVSGKLTFESLYENQRPGLLLLNGIVYIGFASHGDNGPWHGWILGYNAATLAQTGAYCPSPNGTGSGFWMSGGGLAADQLNPTTQPYGRMFVPTGNGDLGNRRWLHLCPSKVIWRNYCSWQWRRRSRLWRHRLQRCYQVRSLQQCRGRRQLDRFLYQWRYADPTGR
jgi:PQQ-like domain